MKYTIIVDKQSRINPSNERKQYEIDIEELRVQGDVYDSLVITREETYVMRRLKLSEYHVLSVLEEPIKEVLTELNIELFEGDNYIYLVDMVGNKFYAEYLVKNDFTDTYVTVNQMNSAINQTAGQIELTVNQKLEGYSTTEEMNSVIRQTAQEINLEVSKKVGDGEIISKINQSAEKILISGDKIDIDGKAVHFKTNINKTIGPFTETDQQKVLKHIVGTLKLTGQEFEKYDLNNDGEINTYESLIIARAIANGGYYTFSGTYEINPDSINKSIALYDSGGYYQSIISLMYNYFKSLYVGSLETKIADNKTSSGVYSGVINIRQDDTSNSIWLQVDTEYDNKPTTSISLMNGNSNKNSNIYLITQEDNALINIYANSKETKISADGINTPQVTINGEGPVMYGMNNNNKYRCNWTGSQLQFWVDETNVGTLSDKRLKTEIKDIDIDFINAIKEIEMKQFKIANRNGLISFGILAQDLIEIFKKCNKNPFDYEIVQETQYRTDDDTVYYTINYEQYLILKTKAQEKELEELKEKDRQKDELIEDLIKRIEKLEVQNGNN